VHRLLKRVVENYPPKMKEALSHMPKFSLESQTVPFREEFTGNVERPLLLLMSAVGIVLLIGCADVANLMFSRMVGQQRELALRTALGAARWRLARQTLIEGLVLSVTGGALGLCFAFGSTGCGELVRGSGPCRCSCALLPAIFPVKRNRLEWADDGIRRRRHAGNALRVLSGTARKHLSLGPRESASRGRTDNDARQAPTRDDVGCRDCQFALAFLLLTTAGLLTRSLLKATEADPGFRPGHLISAQITLPTAVYKPPAQIAGFFDRLLSELSTLPGARQTGAVSDLPTGSTSNVIISMEGQGRNTERVDTLFCRGNALKALGVTLLRGRRCSRRIRSGSHMLL
jgi:putative ABC transport system permease protein